MPEHGHNQIVNDLPTVVTSWRRHLVARNLSRHTIDGYQRTARFFIEYLKTNDMPMTASDITRAGERRVCACWPLKSTGILMHL